MYLCVQWPIKQKSDTEKERNNAEYSIICSNNDGYKHCHLALVMSFCLSFLCVQPFYVHRCLFQQKTHLFASSVRKIYRSKPRQCLTTGQWDRSTSHRMSGDRRNNEPQITERKRGRMSSSSNKLSTTRSAACREYLGRDLREEILLLSM